MEKKYSFKVGDGVSECIGSDSYPATVRRISDNEKYIWVSRDQHRRGLYVPLDLPEKKWQKYSLRKDGYYRQCGHKYGYIHPERRLYLDPSF